MTREKTVFEKLFEANKESVETFAHLVRDLNVDAVLRLLNVPSRAEHEQVLDRLAEMQGRLLNVSLKLDRLLAEHAAAAESDKRKKKKKKKKKTKKQSRA